MPSTALRRRVTGPTLPWARDGALIGGAAGLLAPLGGMALIGMLGAGLEPFTDLGAYALATGALGATSGLFLGAMAPAVLERLRGRMPLWLVAGVAMFFGAAWGGAVGGLGAAAVFGLHGEPGLALAIPGAVFGGLAGAVLLGLSWLPYTVQAVLGGRRWPVVAAVALAAPAVGAGLIGLLAVLG